MSDLELQQLFDNTFDCYTYYEDDSMEEVKEPAMTKATFTAEVFKLLQKQANDARTEKSKCAIPIVSNNEVAVCGLGANPWCRFRNKKLECTSLGDCKHKQTDC